MRTFRLGQRVRVKQTHDGIAIGADGEVVRIRTGKGAWIALDVRHKAEGVHPFPVGDYRATQVLAYPNDCELSKGTRREKRQAERAKDEPRISLATFGRDHASTFGYLEIVCVDHNGEPRKEKMRCDAKRHPFHAHEGCLFGEPSPTRLAGGVLLHAHDDWDCAEDLEAEGLLENVGSTIYPRYRLTERGKGEAARLRQHKANGASFATFVWVDRQGVQP